uniref:Fibronectin type III domain-containing protein n=1 Tax=Candidatus Kentrum sp. LFY TaxID=2126342 RepID=A0A450V043_9GAMM|nr:MAG: Fibronectin type III domain-containing protein [Candidatus Kentron sp. LFY]VFJ98139.1 MAG: Fibronectin type III domain-containing protein [Candidatus Kentron sp. LFY]
MATFPSEESKIFILGQEMSAGLKANSDIYPAPPVTALALDEALTAYVAKRDAASAAQAAAERATAAKQENLQALADKIRTNLRYAEMAVDFDDARLKTIGWGGRKGKTSLAPPGRVVDLADAGQGEGWIELRWEKPADGGKVAAYKILCRERSGNGEWKSEDTAISTEIRLAGQPRGKELEYCVVAINKAGEGPGSNVVMAVL